MTPTEAPNGLLELLHTRRSVKPACMAEPGPTAAQLDAILSIAARVPYHKKLVPWRFIVFEGAARAAFGAVLAEACVAEEATPPSPVRLDLERGRFTRAPLVIGVVSRISEVKGAPQWEQELSCGAACMNLCLAANALGFGTSWLTEWYSYSPMVVARLALAANERLAGFVYVGTAVERQEDRERPALGQIVTRWQG